MSDITKVSKNFGRIKSVFNNLLSEGVIEKNESKKGLFKEYLKAIKENEILKTQFLVYTNIENKVENDAAKATQFVKENIDLFSKFTKKQILESNSKLVQKILFEDEPIDERAELYENISTLIFTPRTASSIETIVEATSKVVEYILDHKAKEVVEIIELPNSMLSTMMVDKYNEKYASLDESEKQVLKVLIESTDEEKKEVYSTTLRECIDLINEKLDTSDLDAKDKLLRVKDKLLNDKQEINEDFFKNISKLVELRNNLN
jgi:hypothetical protein